MKIFTVLAVALLVGVVVFGFISFYQKDELDSSIKQAAEYANCDQATDKDLCRFLAIWELGQDYTLNATENKNGQSTNYSLTSRGDNFHMTVDGDQHRQVTAQNNKIYALIGDEWYEQELSGQDDKNAYRETNQLKFLNLDNSDNFTMVGEEKCLQAECLRYKITGHGGEVDIWFDKKQYQLQRVLIRGGNGYSYNAIVDYSQPKEIVAPSNTKKVSTSQRILPGGTQVSAAQTNTAEAASGDLPATGDSGDPEEYKQWLKKRQQ